MDSARATISGIPAARAIETSNCVKLPRLQVLTSSPSTPSVLFLDTAIMLASRVAVRSARVAAPRMSVAATRGYAEPAKAPEVNSKPPVALFGVDGTYASALVRSEQRRRSSAGCSGRSESIN